MTKTQEYLKNKKIQEMGLPKLYVVKSSPDGVEKPIERQVVEIEENVAFRGKERLPIDRYKVENGYPYEIDFLRGENTTKENGYGSGIGDLWGWSYFSTFSEEEAKMYYNLELSRVQKKYNKSLDIRNTFRIFRYKK
jgi:hypothetical protein